MSKGGGSTSPTNTVSTTTNLPTYAQPYYESALNTAGAITGVGTSAGIGNMPQYTGELVAGFNPLQQNAVNSSANLQSTYQPQMADAYTAAQNAVTQPTTFNYSGQTYDPTQFSATQINAPSLQDASVQGPTAYTADNLQQYMDPYVQNVINTNMASAVQNYQTLQNQNAAQAVNQGAYGGGRDAVVQGVTQNGLAQQLSSIENQGLESAYQNAQGEFNTQNQLGLQSQLANQSSFNQTQDLMAQLGYSTQAANQQAGLTAQQLAEQSSQFGATYDMNSALAAAQGQAQAQEANQANNLQGASVLGSLGTQNLSDQSNALATQYQMGAQQQGLQQQQDTSAYNQYVNNRDYAKNQLAYYMSLLTASPQSINSNVTNAAANPSTISQLGGLGIAGLGLSNLIG